MSENWQEEWGGEEGGYWGEDGNWVDGGGGDSAAGDWAAGDWGGGDDGWAEHQWRKERKELRKEDHWKVKKKKLRAEIRRNKAEADMRDARCECCLTIFVYLALIAFVGLIIWLARKNFEYDPRKDQKLMESISRELYIR